MQNLLGLINLYSMAIMAANVIKPDKKNLVTIWKAFKALQHGSIIKIQI